MKTFTIHGLLHCFNTFQEQNNLKLNSDLSFNSVVSKELWNQKDSIISDLALLNNIHIAITNDKTELEKWNEKKDFFKYSIDNSIFYLKTIYLFDQKWKSKIKTIPEHIKENSKSLKLNNVFGVKGKLFNVDGHNICLVETQNGHILIKEKHSESSFSDCYLKFSEINKTLKNMRSFDLDLYIPTFKIEDEFSFAINGFEPFFGLKVTEAKNKNILSFDKDGVFVKSETKVTMTRSISIKKELLLSDDFELAVFENNSVYPSIIARIDKQDLLK